jgi:Zn-dependent protease with chaperone function
MLSRSLHRKQRITAWFIALLVLIAPISSFAQTQIKPPGNKYKVQDDVQLGQQASAEVEKELPILNDSYSTQYVQNVGRRLVAAIPPQYQQSAFRYSFKIVNARDINAFALPGGAMYVNRGMIEAARNEGEMAGVMAHEISHVALRHGTAQITKAQKYQWLALGGAIAGAILGGGIGEAVGQGSVMAVGAYLLKFSREYETQADVLGSQILARADYDPEDLANMFRTIEQQGGSRGPQWLSSHPNPSNRYQRINQEAALLDVSSNPIRDTAEFRRVKARFREMSPAPSMEEISKNKGGNTGGNSGGGGYGRVSYPSSRYRAYNGGNLFRLSVPDNWREFESETEITFAPDGAYGRSGITYGTMIGITQASNRNLRRASEDYVNRLLQNNSYLRQQSGFFSGYIDGRDSLGINLAGRSNVTGQTEYVTVYTTLLRNGNLFYLITVSQQDGQSSFNRAFQTMIRSIQLYD